MASLALAFDILARDRASKTFDKVGRSADDAGRKGKGFGSAVKAGLGIAAGAFAALGIGELVGTVKDQLGEAIAEARESEKVGKTTAQIIKSTGGAAKVTADQVGDLATAISNKAGIDDEAIQSGANLLLTFKKVRNEVGKGNDIFDRATQAATDLSAAGFGSIEGSSKMLGKALNDPLKGITALGRAGVTFTDQQKKQIKTLVESGKTLEAQKIILGEVESQVGGVAEANATMGEKVQVAVGNLKESIGTALLPVLDRLGQWFLEKGLPALQNFGGWISGRLWPALQQGYKTILPGLKQALDIVKGGVGDNSVSWKAIGEVITTKVIPVLANIARVYLPMVATQWRIIIEVIKGVWKVFQTLMSIVGNVVKFLLRRFADLANMWAGVLRALSHVPGFGWAKGAADKLKNAAGKADALANAIDRIPDSKNIKINFSAGGVSKSAGGGTVTSGRVFVPGLGYVNAAARAGGGPVTAGRAYAVGDNPDGSWNRTTELFVPNTSGRIYNQKQLASMPAAGVGAGEVQVVQHFHGITDPYEAAQVSFNRMRYDLAVPR